MSSNADTHGPATRIAADQIVIPSASVSIYQALYGRRMAWKFKDEPVSREAIQRMLDVAVWAPNHRLTEPWRFFVLEKESSLRRKAAELAYDFVLENTNVPGRALAARHKVLDPPLVIYVYCVPGPSEETTRENYAAVSCAAQNISLAGVAEGLAVAWETGGPVRHPDLKETLGAEPDWAMVAMLSIGVPAENLASHRTPVSSFVRWFSQD
jgi:nitroreductase